MSITPTDPAVMMSLNQQDMIQRKLDMDNLRKSLNNGQSKEAKLREACEGFESIFVQKIWEQMRKNVQQDGYLHSRDEQMYQGMYDAEFAKKMTAAGGIGLADMLYEQLSQRLGESSRTTSPQNNPKLPIIPAGSTPSKIAVNMHGLTPEEPKGIAMPEARGIPLQRPTFRPEYEAVEEAQPVAAAQGQAVAANGEAAQAGSAATEQAALVPPQVALEEDFEDLSQQLLRQEMENTPEANAALPEQESEALKAALQDSMNEAQHAPLAELLKNYSGRVVDEQEPS